MTALSSQLQKQEGKESISVKALLKEYLSTGLKLQEYQGQLGKQSTSMDRQDEHGMREWQTGLSSTASC